MGRDFGTRIQKATSRRLATLKSLLLFFVLLISNLSSLTSNRGSIFCISSATYLTLSRFSTNSDVLPTPCLSRSCALLLRRVSKFSRNVPLIPIDDDFWKGCWGICIVIKEQRVAGLRSIMALPWIRNTLNTQVPPRSLHCPRDVMVVVFSTNVDGSALIQFLFPCVNCRSSDWLNGASFGTVSKVPSQA